MKRRGMVRQVLAIRKGRTLSSIMRSTMQTSPMTVPARWCNTMFVSFLR